MVQQANTTESGSSTKSTSTSPIGSTSITSSKVKPLNYTQPATQPEAMPEPPQLTTVMGANSATPPYVPMAQSPQTISGIFNPETPKMTPFGMGTGTKIGSTIIPEKMSADEGYVARAQREIDARNAANAVNRGGRMSGILRGAGIGTDPKSGGGAKQQGGARISEGGPGGQGSASSGINGTGGEPVLGFTPVPASVPAAGNYPTVTSHFSGPKTLADARKAALEEGRKGGERLVYNKETGQYDVQDMSRNWWDDLKRDVSYAGSNIGNYAQSIEDATGGPNVFTGLATTGMKGLGWLFDAKGKSRDLIEAEQNPNYQAYKNQAGNAGIMAKSLADSRQVSKQLDEYINADSTRRGEIDELARIHPNSIYARAVARNMLRMQQEREQADQGYAIGAGAPGSPSALQRLNAETYRKPGSTPLPQSSVRIQNVNRPNAFNQTPNVPLVVGNQSPGELALPQPANQPQTPQVGATPLPVNRPGPTPTPTSAPPAGGPIGATPLPNSPMMQRPIGNIPLPSADIAKQHGLPFGNTQVPKPQQAGARASQVSSSPQVQLQQQGQSPVEGVTGNDLYQHTRASTEGRQAIDDMTGAQPFENPYTERYQTAATRGFFAPRGQAANNIQTPQRRLNLQTPAIKPQSPAQNTFVSTPQPVKPLGSTVVDRVAEIPSLVSRKGI